MSRRLPDFGVMSGVFSICKLIVSTYAWQIVALFTSKVIKPGTSPPKLSLEGSVLTAKAFKLEGALLHKKYSKYGASNGFGRYSVGDKTGKCFSHLKGAPPLPEAFLH